MAAGGARATAARAAPRAVQGTNARAAGGGGGGARGGDGGADGLEVVPGHDRRRGGGGGGYAGRGRNALGGEPRPRLGEQPVDVAVVGAGELHEPVAPGDGAREPDGAHRRL